MILGYGQSWADLVAVLFALLATVVTVLLEGPSIFRVPLALLLVFFIPGYVLTTALFPLAKSISETSEVKSDRYDGIGRLDRLVLSVGLSLSTIIMMDVIFNLFSIPLTTKSLLDGIVTVTVCVISVAFYRRQQVPLRERFTPIDTAGPKGSSGMRDHIDLISIILALSVLFSVVAVAYSVSVMATDDGITEFYFQTEQDDGATEYPTNLTQFQREPVPLVIGNREGEQITYTVIGRLQEVEERNGTMSVEEQREVHRDTITVAADETREVNTTVAPETAGRYRLTFLLYRTQPPAQPRMSNAYRKIHIWVTVTESTNQTST